MGNKYWKNYGLLLFMVFLGTTGMVFLGGCGSGGDGGDPAAPLKAGDTYEAVWSTLSGDQDVVYKTVVYKAHNLGTTGKEPEAMTLLEDSRKLLNAGSRKMESQGPNLSSKKRAEKIRGWLLLHWDPYIGNAQDPGLDAAQFLAFAEKHRLSGATLINLYDTSGMGSMQKFVTFVEETTKAFPEVPDPLEDLAWLVHRLPNLSKEDGDLTFGTFLNHVNTAFPQEGYRGLFKTMKKEKLDFQGLYNRYYGELVHNPETITGIASFLQKLAEGRVSADGKIQKGKIDTVLEALKLAWDVIKDNRPTSVIHGASTAVLLQSDQEPLNYYSARDGKSTETKFYMKNGFGMKVIQFHYEGVCKYKALHKSSRGHFLPDVHLKVLKASVLWGFKLNASAEISRPANVSTDPDNPDPQVDMHLSIQSGGIFQNFTDYTEYRIQGSKGIWRTGGK